VVHDAVIGLFPGNSSQDALVPPQRPMPPYLNVSAEQLSSLFQALNEVECVLLKVRGPQISRVLDVDKL
jgi:hypothetical protein